MDNELIRYANGSMAPVRQEKGVARQAKRVYDEVRMTALKVDGQMALGAHIMQKAKELDDLRHELAGQDPGLHAIMVDIEKTAFAKVNKFQRELFDGWNM